MTVERDGKAQRGGITGFLLLFFFLFSFFPQVLSFKLFIDLHPLLPLSFDFHVKPFMILTLLCTPLFIIGIRRFRILGYEPFMLIFYVYFMSTIIVAEHKGTSFKLIVGTLIMLYAFFVARAVLQRNTAVSLESAIAVSGLVFNAVSLLMYAIGFVSWASEVPRTTSYTHTGLMVIAGIPRLSGLVYDANYFVIFDSLFFFYYLSNLRKRWNTVGLLCAGVAILLTVSIGGIGAVFITFMINLLLEKDGPTRRKILLLFSAAVAAFIAVYFAVLRDTRFFAYRLESLRTGSYRYMVWRYALTVFKERPLFGIGLFNFRHFSQELFKIMNIHNTWLQALVEGGTVGFVLFAWFNFSALRGIVRLYKKDESVRYLLLSFISIMLIFLSLSALIHEIYFLILALTSRYMETAVPGNGGGNERRG
ncbi:MAG: O-antigen ligase family protein [Spirochaetes bacterium]|nr:O-antigen ligase family protein [Spirochaetota bacterium]